MVKVVFGYSIPLDELGRNGQMKPVKRPLAGWGQRLLRFATKLGIRLAIRRVSGIPLPFEP